MIKGTYSDCKIQSISTSNSTAIIHCIIYSSVPAEKQKAFKFYIRDKNNPLELFELSENVYWIDRLNNYNNDATNIDVNQYLDLILNIDITNRNRSSVQDNKWVRHCNLILKELNSNEDEYAWISQDLTLISKEFEIPKIENLDICSDDNYNINISYKLFYKSQQDFSYNDQNIYTTINICSLYTDTELETIDVYEEDINNQTIKIKSNNTYISPVKIKIQLKNSNGSLLQTVEKFYKPIQRQTNTFIKTSNGIKKVLAFYVKEIDYNETTS